MSINLTNLSRAMFFMLTLDFAMIKNEEGKRFDGQELSVLGDLERELREGPDKAGLWGSSWGERILRWSFR
jgi:hypothetical protein